MAKIIKNPTDNTVRIVIDGKEFSVEADGSTAPLADKIVERWIHTHRFLRAESVDVASEEEKEEEKLPEPEPKEQPKAEKEVFSKGRRKKGK